MSHSKDFRNYPARLNKLAETLAGKQSKVEYTTTRRAAEHDRATFYAFRAAARIAAADGDHEARMIMLGISGTMFTINPPRTRGTKNNEESVQVVITSWGAEEDHPMVQSIREANNQHEQEYKIKPTASFGDETHEVMTQEELARELEEWKMPE